MHICCSKKDSGRPSEKLPDHKGIETWAAACWGSGRVLVMCGLKYELDKNWLSMTYRDAPAWKWRAGSDGLRTSFPDLFFCDSMTEGKRQLICWHQYCVSKRKVPCLTTQDWEITGGKAKLQLCTSAKWPHFKVSFQYCWSHGSCHYLQEEHNLSQNCPCCSLQILKISRWTLHPKTLGPPYCLKKWDGQLVSGCPHTDCCGLCCFNELVSILGPRSELEGQREHHWDISATPCWEPHLDLSQAAGECCQGCPEKLSFCLLNCIPWFNLTWQLFWEHQKKVETRSLGKESDVLGPCDSSRFTLSCHMLNLLGKGWDIVCQEIKWRLLEADFPIQKMLVVWGFCLFLFVFFVSNNEMQCLLFLTNSSGRWRPYPIVSR